VWWCCLQSAGAEERVGKGGLGLVTRGDYGNSVEIGRDNS